MLAFGDKKISLGVKKNGNIEELEFFNIENLLFIILNLFHAGI